MRRVGFALIGLLTATAILYGWRSLGHLSEEEGSLRKALLFGPWAKRDVFTERGWRYRNYSYWSILVAMTLFLILNFVMGN